MGATMFMTRVQGSSPEKAFAKAVEEALYWHGRGGYTGHNADPLNNAF
jgi:hypothetical protein